MEDNPEFCVPDNPDDKTSSKGGKRTGAGRKRVYEEGYESVRHQLWKTISLHTTVHEEWTQQRNAYRCASNTEFARLLLENFKSVNQQSQSVTSSSQAPTPEETMTRYTTTDILDFSPERYSTPRPRGDRIRTSLFAPSSSVQSSDRTHQKEISVQKYPAGQYNKVFVDTVVGIQSLCEPELDDFVNNQSSSESGSDVVCSDTSSEEGYVENMENLDISYNYDFIAHDYEDIEDSCNDTVTESVDMEISSELEAGLIETNIPVSFEEEIIDGSTATCTRLIPEDFVKKASTSLDAELADVNEKRFICSISKLKELFSFCMDVDCRMPLVYVKESSVGCCLKINWRCKNGHVGDWQSSNQVKKVYVDNIMAASSLLFSGNNFSKISLFAKCLQLTFFSSSTFHHYQKIYLAPQIHSWWNRMQEEMFDCLKEQPVVVSGDGQMDSPGFSAKNCTYTIMHAELYYVLHVEIADVRHSQLKSAVMEKVACERALDFLIKKVNITGFVTDASSQIIKLLATDTRFKGILHQLDIWHKSNKLDKKLHEAAKMRGNNVLASWVPKIRNHFWHCSKDCGGDVQKLKDMWVNVLKHVTDVHSWYGGQCSHGPLNQFDREWLDQDSAPMEALRQIVLDKQFLKSLPFYTHFQHTGKLEAYHSHRLMYAPKRFGFAYDGIFARSLLAAIDHNLHLHRKQAKNANGDLVFSRRWSKRANRWKLVIVKEKKDYAYLPVMCALVLKAVATGSSQPIHHSNDPKFIAPTIAKLPAPPTSQLVEEHQTRF